MKTKQREYIFKMATELAQLSHDEGFDFLAYLLQMAAREAASPNTCAAATINPALPDASYLTSDSFYPAGPRASGFPGCARSGNNQRRVDGKSRSTRQLSRRIFEVTIGCVPSRSHAHAPISQQAFNTPAQELVLRAKSRAGDAC